MALDSSDSGVCDGRSRNFGRSKHVLIFAGWMPVPLEFVYQPRHHRRGLRVSHQISHPLLPLCWLAIASIHKFNWTPTKAPSGRQKRCSSLTRKKVVPGRRLSISGMAALLDSQSSSFFAPRWLLRRWPPSQVGHVELILMKNSRQTGLFSGRTWASLPPPPRLSRSEIDRSHLNLLRLGLRFAEIAGMVEH